VNTQLNINKSSWSELDLSDIFSNITREFMYIPPVNYALSNNKKIFSQERITVFSARTYCEELSTTI